MKVHYPKLYNMAHLSLNVFTASKESNNYILFYNKKTYRKPNEQLFPNRRPLSYPNLSTNMKTYMRGK